MCPCSHALILDVIILSEAHPSLPPLKGKCYYTVMIKLQIDLESLL